MNVMPSERRTTMIYHIISIHEWEMAQQKGVYAPSSLSNEGFIHCSTEKQVTGVANSLYKGRTDLIVLEIEEDQVDAKIVFEDLYHLNQQFPHIYGVLNVNAVTKLFQFQPDQTGEFIFVADEADEISMND